MKKTPFATTFVPTPAFVQITNCCDSDGMTVNLHALDVEGNVWYYFETEKSWFKLHMVYEVEKVDEESLKRAQQRIDILTGKRIAPEPENEEEI